MGLTLEKENDPFVDSFQNMAYLTYSWMATVTTSFVIGRLTKMLNKK